MAETSVAANELKDLRAKCAKLSEELSFERQMNNLLENIRNYCLLMLNECQCPMSTVGENMQVFHKINRQFIQLKAKQVIDSIDSFDVSICDHRECSKTRDISDEPNDISEDYCPPPDDMFHTTADPSDISAPVSAPLNADIDQEVAEEVITANVHQNDMLDANQSFAETADEPALLEAPESPLPSSQPDAQSTPKPTESRAESTIKSSPRVKRAYKKSLNGSRQLRSAVIKTSRVKTLRSNRQKNITQFSYIQDRAKLGPKPKGRIAKLTSNELNSPSKQRELIKGMGPKSSNTSYKCSECHLLLPSEIKLLNHLSYKHKIRSFSCQLCDYKTTQTYYLKRHMTCHTDAKPFKCDIPGCDKRFKTRAIVLAHKRQSHAPSRPFGCPLCEYSATTKSRLDSHMLTHSQEKPFQCDVKGCEKWFKTSVAVYQHKVVVHSGQTFLCDWPQCGRTYKSKYALDLHRKLHSIDKQFFCGINGCVKGFKEKRNLKRHQQKCIQNFLCTKK